MSKAVNGSPKSRSSRSLKTLWINPRYQRRYIFWISLTGLALVFIQTAVFYFFTRENYALLVDLGPMTDEAKQQLYKELWQIIGYLTGGSLAFLFVVAIVGLVFSHRAAGPLYKLRRTFEEIRTTGNLSPRVRLRPRDDFQEVATAFNEMMDVIQKSTHRGV